MAQLSVLRQRFVQMTGRYDLVVDDTNWVDAGANRFINAGQAYLDHKLAHPKLEGRRVVNLSAGQQMVSLRYLRRVKKVYLFDRDTSMGLGKLDLVDQDLLLTRFLDAGTSEAQRGQPLYFCMDTIGLAPEQKSVTDLSSFEGVSTILTGDHYSYKGIQLYPAADKPYTIQLLAAFYSAPLNTDTDLSFWTNAETEELLLQAACYCHEISLRNFQGANDYRAAIEDQTKDLQKDIVELEVQDEHTTMWG